MQKQWFRAKHYGYGWVPVTWQGWVTVVIYLCLVIISVSSNTVRFHQVVQNIFQVIAEIIFYTLILILICYYTGEKPHWQWEKRKS